MIDRGVSIACIPEEKAQNHRDIIFLVYIELSFNIDDIFIKKILLLMKDGRYKQIGTDILKRIMTILDKNNMMIKEHVLYRG